MAKKRSTKTKGWAIAYKSENRASKNKIIKIARHQKEHPNDRQEVGAVPDYRRRKPIEYVYGGVQKSVSTSQRSSGRS